MNIEYHFERGELLLSRGRFQAAEREFRKMVAVAPEMSIARAMLALSLAGQNKAQLEDAIQESHAAIALDPTCDFSHFALAQCLSYKKDYPAALTACDEAIRINPEHEHYWHIRATILANLNRYDGAKKSLRNALAIAPEFTLSLALLSIIESNDAKSSGEPNARSAVRSDPEDSMPHLAMGLSHITQHDGMAAFDAFREAIRLNPNNKAARSGMLESLRIQNPFCRIMLYSSRFVTNLGDRRPWAIIAGLLIASLLLSIASLQNNYNTGPILIRVFIAVIAIWLFTWLVRPISYFILLFYQNGRMAMNRKEKLSGMLLVAMLAIGLTLCYASTATDNATLFYPGICVLLCIIPVCSVLSLNYKVGHVPLFQRGLVVAQLISGTTSVGCATAGLESGAGISIFGCLVLGIVFMLSHGKSN